MRRIVFVGLISLFLVLVTNCGSPEKSLFSRYFEAVKFNDKTTMSTMAYEPIALEFTKWRLVSLTQEEKRSLPLNDLYKKQDELKVKRDDVINQLADLKDKLDEAKAKHLKSIGVDKIQLSIDGLDPVAHDEFRRKTGSFERCLKALDASLSAGLNVIIQTVVTKQRIRSQEFIDFIEFFNKKGVGVFVTYAKPVGDWEGNFDVLVTKEDMDYMRELEKKYNVFTHLTPAYGLNLGCIAV